MTDTAARLLSLLTMLHAGPERGGAELATRLGVAPRTVRRDVERLRALGYPVEAVQGTAGYRLGSGNTLPPLVLGDEEAVAVVLGLRGAAQQSVTGIEEAALQALTKVEHVMPARLRHRVRTLASTTQYGGEPPEAHVDLEVLMTLAEGCRRNERLRFDYANGRGEASRREVEPHRVISFNRRWYLVAFDVGRDAWRTFRVDRLTPRIPFGRRFEPREVPTGDALTYLERALAVESWQLRAVIRLRASADVAAGHVWPGMGAIEPEGPETCLLHIGGPNASDLLWMVTSVGLDFEVVDGPDELRDGLRELAHRCLAALGG